MIFFLWSRPLRSLSRRCNLQRSEITLHCKLCDHQLEQGEDHFPTFPLFLQTKSAAEKFNLLLRFVSVYYSHVVVWLKCTGWVKTVEGKRWYAQKIFSLTVEYYFRPTESFFCNNVVPGETFTKNTANKRSLPNNWRKGAAKQLKIIVTGIPEERSG